MHLHPQWQQTILSDLHAIFPKIQFIVSSHAPAVIKSVQREQIRILDNGKIVEITDPDIATTRAFLDLEKILRGDFVCA